jgi:hypothetical protein
VAGIWTRRCASCDEVVLVVDRGRLKAVGETRYVETLPDGSTVLRCVCGARTVWARELEGAGQ